MKKKQAPFSAVVSEEQLQKALEKRENARTEEFLVGYRELCAKTKRQITPKAVLEIGLYDPSQDPRVKEEAKKKADKAKGKTPKSEPEAVSSRK